MLTQAACIYSQSLATCKILGHFLFALSNALSAQFEVVNFAMSLFHTWATDFLMHVLVLVDRRHNVI